MLQVSPEILFSISIPTYNRAHLLKRCLESLFIWNNANELPVEVSVYNNNSTDNTEELVMDFIAKGYKIRYSKSNPAIDGNLNIYQCYQKARGKYMVCMGDDDAFLTGSLKSLIDYLSVNEIGALYLKGRDAKELESQQPVLNEPLSVKVLDTGLDYIKKVHYNIAFISSNVIRNPQINENEVVEEIYMNFYHVPSILQQVFSGYKNGYTDTKLLYADQFYSVNYDVVTLFLKNFITVIFITPKLSDEIKKKVISIIEKEMIISFFPFMMYNMRLRNNLANTEKSIDILRQHYKGSIYYHLFVVPMYKYPLLIARIAKKVSGFYVLCRMKLNG